MSIKEIHYLVTIDQYSFVFAKMIDGKGTNQIVSGINKIKNLYAKQGHVLSSVMAGAEIEGEACQIAGVKMSQLPKQIKAYRIENIISPLKAGLRKMQFAGVSIYSDHYAQNRTNFLKELHRYLPTFVVRTLNYKPRRFLADKEEDS